MLFQIVTIDYVTSLYPMYRLIIKVVFCVTLVLTSFKMKNV